MASSESAQDKRLEAGEPGLQRSRSTSESLKAGKDLSGPITPTLSIVERTDSQAAHQISEKDVESAEKGNTPARPPLGLMDPSSFPDGGIKAWSCVLGGFCALFVSFGWINCIGVFQNYYQTHSLSQYSSSEIAWVPSVETFVMLGVGPVVGRIYDSYGPRWLLVGGTLLHVFGLMMTSPIGAGAVFYPSVSAVSTWFFKRRAFALGVTVAGSSLGGVIFPIMVERLVSRVGFGWTMRICAFLILFLCVIANLTVRARIPPNPRPFRFMDFIDPLFELAFLLNAIAYFLFYFGMFIPFTYIILSGTANGMSASLAGYLVPILNAASVIGRTLPPYLADKYGRFNVMICVAYFCGIVCLGLWLPARANAPIIVFAGLFGFGSGAAVGLGPAMVAQISKIQQIGTRVGTLFLLNSIAALIGSPVAGALVKTSSGGHMSFTDLQIFCGVMMLGGACIFVAARIVIGGPSPKKIIILALDGSKMSVRVVSRIRPLLKSENATDTIINTDSSEASYLNVVKIPNPKNSSEEFSFQFNSVYEQDSTQQALFDAEVAPTIKHLFNGYDVTIFAYGSTGTGKTHTMRGGKALADRGMIPRMLSNIFRRAKKMEKDEGGETQVEVSMSYYEIYNDRVFDLFEMPEKRTPTGLPVREIAGGKAVVVGLTERDIRTLKEFEILYDEANQNRSTGATKLNAHSSRSHAILCVKISITNSEGTRTSTASAIDLAGSEDNRRTGNGKERLVESASINKSLFVLAQCVEAISKKQPRIPYRESKMTRILSLGQNNGFTIMILNLAPTRAYHLDTLSSLNFANRTKKIEVKEVENEPVFRGPPRAVSGLSSLGGENIQRQPLRPLNARVNMNLGAQSNGKATEKPVKAFAVYSDKARPRNSGSGSSAVRRSDAPKRVSPSKRGSDSTSFAARPAKMMKPPPSSARLAAQTSLTKANIEDMVSKKVEEILAAKALDAKIEPPSKTISEEVQQRLDSIEQRLEGQEGAKAEGLSYLLMAKQHQAREEYVSALKMFQLALPYFPDNVKLLRKIEVLQQKTLSRKQPVEPTVVKPQSIQQPSQASSRFVAASLSRSKANKSEDESYVEERVASEDEGYDSDSSFRVRNKITKTGQRSAVEVPSNDGGANATPRTAHLLHVINTRDVGQIKLLRGVGAKKAENIVNCLCEMDDELAGSSNAEIQSLTQLGRLKGVGLRTVQNMRTGIEV
ncbi:MAG: hypothetical protein Q9227_005305 [Pyrenula ochraceoflavens]